ncbi:hypothetical protein NQ104_24185, partial [Peribacillus frigoritolerans]|uniref:hypothetical protein n=1 Tax=Peribacillus frigoritolerans TaxID=450367 RepID=UPI00215B4BB9
TAVKLFSADGSWGFPPVRVGRRQAIKKISHPAGLFLFVIKKFFRFQGQYGLALFELVAIS